LNINKMKQYKGIVTALITPVTNDLDIDTSSLKMLIDTQVKYNIRGFFVLGTYGEGLLLHPDKRKRFIEKIVDLVSSNTLIINNVSSTSLELSIELIKHSRDLGIYNVASLPPLYYRAGADGVKRYYRELGKYDCNVLIYNYPDRAGFDVSPKILYEISSENSSIIGIKDSTGRIDRLIDLVDRFSNYLYIAIANDSLILDAFLYGADAHVCGLCNAIPEISDMLYKSIIDKDYAKAVMYQKIINRIRTLAKELDLEGSSVVKAILKLRGINTGTPIPPNKYVMQQEVATLKRVIEDIYNQLGIEFKLEV